MAEETRDRYLGWYVRRFPQYWRLFLRRFVQLPARRLVRHYRNDPWFAATMSLKGSALINGFFVLYQAFNAITRSSWWFAVLAGYYVILTWMRVMLVRFMEEEAPDGREELRRFRRIGGWLFMLTGVVVGMGIVVNRVGHRPSYPGHMVLVMVAFTLYNITFAAVNLVRSRRLEDPVIEASKALALATTLVSIYTLQAATIGWFEAYGDLAVFMNYATPILVFLGVAAVSSVMIARSTWALSMGQRTDDIFDEWITGEHASVRLMELRSEAFERFRY